MNRLANYCKPWTRIDDSRLRELIREEGCNFKEAAPLMHRTRGAVAQRASSMKLKVGRGRKPNINSRIRVLSLLELGLTLAQIARVIGRKEPSVYEMVRRMVVDGLVERIGPPIGPGCNPGKVRYKPVK